MSQLKRSSSAAELTESLLDRQAKAPKSAPTGLRLLRAGSSVNNGALDARRKTDQQAPGKTEDQLRRMIQQEVASMIADDNKPEGLENTDDCSRLYTSHPAFEEVEKHLSSICADGAAIIRESQYREKQIVEIGGGLSKTSSTPLMDAKRIGIVGESGVGKSSLINALLDEPDLAETADMGEACTNVVVEYRYLWPNQTTPFAARISFYSSEEITCILKDHLKAFYEWRCEDHEDGDSAKKDEYKRRGETAWDTFQNMNKKTKIQNLTQDPALIRRADVLDILLRENQDKYKKIDLRSKSLTAKAEAENKNALKDLMTRRGALENLRLRALIEFRNTDVKAKMQTKYARDTNSTRTLRTVCVASLKYLEQSTAPKHNDEFTLSLTGIPELRTWVLRLPSEEAFSSLEFRATTEIPRTLLGLERWCTRSEFHRRDEILAVLRRPDDSLDEEIDDMIAQIQQLLSSSIAGTISRALPSLLTSILIRPDLNKSNYGLEGWKMARGWAKWAAGTYDAWCRHEGDWQTKNQDLMSWNKEFLKGIVNDTDAEWRALDNAINEMMSNCEERIKSLQEVAMKELQDMLQDNPVALKLLTESVKFSRKSVQRTFQNGVKSALALTRELMLNSTTDEQDSYFVVGMKPIYDIVAAEKGTGRKARQNSAMETTLLTSTPFADINLKILNKFRERMIGWGKATKGELHGHLQEPAFLLDTDPNLIQTWNRTTIRLRQIFLAFLARSNDLLTKTVMPSLEVIKRESVDQHQ
ncbi:hypothetical protein MMC25_000947 [Agyrium rufum]|nr:hypothetical protein [Agyrium rufum]